MNAPVTVMEHSAVHNYAQEFKEELLGVVLHASAALEAPTPGDKASGEFLDRYYDCKKATFRFVTDVLDPLVGVPAYLKRQQQMIANNLQQANDHIETLMDGEASEEAKAAASQALQVPADTIYFCLNNSCGKVLTLHGNLTSYRDTMAKPVLALQKMADGMLKAPTLNGAKKQIDAFETQKQHLAVQLRAASWHLVSETVGTEEPYKLANVAIDDTLDWAQVPFVSVAAQAGGKTIALDGEKLVASKAKMQSLYQDMCEEAKDVFHANAIAGTFSSLMMHARDVLAQRKQICDVVAHISEKIDQALKHCTDVQLFLRQGHHADAARTFHKLGSAWKEAIDLANHINLDVAYCNNEFVTIGMEDGQLRSRLDGQGATHALASDIF